MIFVDCFLLVLMALSPSSLLGYQSLPDASTGGESHLLYKYRDR